MIDTSIAKKSIQCLVAVSLLFLLATTVSAGDWPNWRGPDHNGISKETNIQFDWKKHPPKRLWKTHVGTGFSSIVTSQGKAFTMGNVDDEDILVCIDIKTGKKVWESKYKSKLKANMYEGGPNATPTIGGNLVYTQGKHGDLICWKTSDGSKVWEKNIRKEYNIKIPMWGLSGSPLIHGDMLIVNAGLTGLAFNKASGELIWKGENGTAGYSSPVPYALDGQEKVAMFSGKYISAVEAKTGKKLWRHRWKTAWNVNAADPIIQGDKMFISSGYDRGCALLNIGAGGPKQIWGKEDMKNQFASSVLWQGHLYGTSGNEEDDAPLICMEFETGKVKWQQKGFTVGSLFLVDGTLVILNDGGELVSVKASPSGYNEVSRMKLLSGRCWTVPTLSNGHLFARNADGTLVCVDISK